MDRVSQALAARLHSIFDADPAPVLALRVRHPAGAGWEVQGAWLTLRTPQAVWRWDLRHYTLGALAQEITQAGFELVYQATALRHLSATTLLEGAGHEDKSNGDHLTILTAPLAALLAAFGCALGQGREDIAKALAQLILPDSTAEWADWFGVIFGIPRDVAEADADYTARIIEEVQRARSSPAAILRNIKRLTGHDLTLREPWRELHVLSQSPLSGTDHLQGAPIYEYHRIQLVARRGIDWTPVLREAEADRPAGTLMLPPATHMAALHVASVGLTTDLGRVGIWAEDLPWNAYGRLSVDLSLSQALSPPRTELGHSEVYGLGTFGLRGPYDYFGDQSRLWVGYWDNRTWDKGNTVTAELYPPKSLES